MLLECLHDDAATDVLCLDSNMIPLASAAYITIFVPIYNIIRLSVNVLSMYKLYKINLSGHRCKTFLIFCQ